MKGCHRKKQDKESIFQGEPWRMVQSAKRKATQALSEGRLVYKVTSNASKKVQNANGTK